MEVSGGESGCRGEPKGSDSVTGGPGYCGAVDPCGRTGTPGDKTEKSEGGTGEGDRRMKLSARWAEHGLGRGD